MCLRLNALVQKVVLLIVWLNFVCLDAVQFSFLFETVFTFSRQCYLL